MPSGDLSNWLFLAQRLFDDLVTLLRVPPTRFGHLVLPASLPAYLWPNNSHLSSVPNLVGHDTTSSSIRPASTLERSRISLIRERRWRPEERMSSVYSACFSLSSPNILSPKTSEKPMIALSGVLSSWDMLARNSDLCRLAASIWRLLSSISR